MKGLVLCLTIFLFFELKLAVGSCPTYFQPDELQGSAISLTRTRSLDKVECSDTTHGPCEAAVDGKADNTAPHQWQTKQSVGEIWFKIILIKEFRLNKISFKQLNSTEFRQIQDVRIEFTGAGNVSLQLSLQKNGWQSFRFAERKTKEIKIILKTFYTTDTRAYGFQEIEIFEENAGKDLLCEHMSLEGTGDGTYPISGGFVVVTLNFPQDNKKKVKLDFLQAVGPFDYRLTVDASLNPIKFTLKPSGVSEIVANLAYPLSKTVDLQLWVDFSSDKFVVGVGSETLATTPHTISTLSQMIFSPEDGTFVNAGFCSQRGACFDDATHHWPMDKLYGGSVGDIAGSQHGRVVAGVGQIVNTGPIVHSGFKTAGISLRESDRGTLNLGDFSALQMMNFRWKSGWTFSFWLRFDSLRNTTTTAKNHAPIFVINGFLEIRRYPNDGFHFIIYREKGRYRVKTNIELTVGKWQHWTLTWLEDEKLTVYYNVVGEMRSHYYEESTWSDSNPPNLAIGCTDAYTDPSWVCDDVTIADVVFWDRRLSSQELMNKFQCSGYRLGQSNSLDIRTGQTLNSGLTASSSLAFGENAEYQASPDRARAGLRAPEGYWAPSRLDTSPFLQVDLNQWVVVTEVAVQGSPEAGGWVTGYTMTYKQNSAPWAFVPYTTGLSVQVLQGAVDTSTLVSNVLPKNITTRFIRLYPTTWVGSIAMRVEVFAGPKAENYEGCFKSPSSLSREDAYDGDNMTPEVCTTLCAQRATHAYLKAGTQCFCSNAVPPTAQGETIAENLCGVPCSGKPGLFCGGVEYVSVYKGKGSYSPPSFALTIPSAVNLGENVSFSVSPLPESDYHIDFGNGQTMRSFKSNMFFVFATAGKFTVRATAMTSGYGEPVEVSAEVLVQVKVPVVASLKCPTAVETNEEFECVFDLVQSPNAALTLDFFGGVATVTDTIQETLQGVVGHDVVPNVESTSDSGIYVFPDLRFESKGKIQAWEVLAMKAGVIRLLIVRAFCLFNTSETYLSSNGVALQASECSSVSCQSAEKFCMSAGSCLSSSGKCGSQSPVSFANKHEIVHEFIAHVSPGLNILKYEGDQLTAQPEVGPGYSIAFHKPADSSAELAKVVQQNPKFYVFSDDVSDVGTMLDTSLITNPATGKVHIKAYYSVGSTQVVKATYPDVGIFNPRARFAVSGSNVDFTTTIVVSESIEGGNWTVTPSPYIGTNETFTVLAKPLTRGYNVTVNVRYDTQGSSSYFEPRVTNEILFDQAFSKRGFKSLSLTYSNALSSVEFSCRVHVQDMVDYLELVEPITVVPTGNESEIVWNLLQGSDLTFEFDLADGTVYRNGTFDIDGVLVVYAKHVYYAPGEYEVNITVFNEVSNLTLIVVAAVEDTIVDMKTEVVHAARDIEVDEVIQFNTTMLNGTSPYYLVQFGDGSDDFGLESLINHSYSSWQVFEANITAWNNVSKATYLLNVTVHKPVRPLINFTITVEPTNHTDPQAFMLEISDGTDYNCSWDFGDGTKGENNYDDLGKYLYHTYANVGVYVVFMNCSNRLYTTNYTTIAIVQKPIEGFDFPELDPIKYTDNAELAWSCVSGTNATYNLTVERMYSSLAQVLLQNDDVTISVDRLTGSHVFPASVDSPHDYGVMAYTLTVWNLVTPPQTIRRELIIDKPIEGAGLTSLETHWEVNKTVTVTTAMSLGTNVTLVFDFGDGNQYEEFVMGEFPTTGVDTYHTFGDDGEYLITLLVKNSVGNVTLELTLFLEYVPDLSLESNSPQIHPSPATVNFTLVVRPGKEPPTDATAVWDFGDGTPLVTKDFDYHDNHTYANPGWYIVVVRVFNAISEMNITGYADVQRVIVTPEVWPVNTAGDNGDGGAGSGPGGLTFPKDYPVRFMTKVADGTNVTYELDYGDGTTDSTNETFLEHQFSSAGTHTIHVTVKNSVSESKFSITIELEEVVKDITIENDSPIVMGTPMTFKVDIGQVGNESCFYLTMKNDSFITFQPELTTTCTLPSFSSDVRMFSGNSFTFEYIYYVMNEYPVTIEGQNLASSVIVEDRAVIVDKPCFYPKAVVIEVGKNVSTARKFIKSRNTVVPTENVIDCEAAVYSKFEWRVFLYDPTRPHIPPGENETTFFHEMINVTGVQYDAPRLMVKQRALDYGIYKAIENVTMIGPQGVWNTDFGFFEIIMSPLDAMIIGGSTRSIGFDKNFTLDANSSGDPDVDVGDREGIQVYWLCKRQSENFTFPEDPGNLTAISMIPRAVSHGPNATDLGGCYGNGPGLLDFTGYLIKLNSVYMNINETYDFRFFIRKVNRTAYYDSSVLIVSGDPPQMAIRCDRNCLEKFNPSEKITLTALCTSCTASSKARLKYKWRLSVFENNIWKKVELEPLANSPTSRDTVVVKGGVLEGGKLYSLRISSWFDGDSSIGFAELARYINVPPSGGKCVSTPSEGYAMKEIFEVNCEGWEDLDLPLRYQITYKNGLDGLESGIYEGMDAVRSNMTMPLGKKESNYTVFIYISVVDKLGAFTTYETRVKVTEEPQSDEEFSNMVSSMTADNGALGNLIAEGNAQAMCQFVGSITSLLNSKAEPEPVVIPPTTIPPAIPVRPLNPKELAALKAKQEREEAERKRREEEARKQRIAAREKMVSAMANVQVTSVTAVQQTSAALQSLLSTPEEVSPNAQAAASQAMDSMADFMLSNAGQASGSALTSAATGLVSGLGHMVSATSSTVSKSNSSAGGNKTDTVNQAKAVVAALTSATEKVSKALAGQTAVGEDPVAIKTPAMALSTVKKLPSELAGSKLKVGDGDFAMPMGEDSGNSSEPVDMKGVGTKDNPFSWDPGASAVQTQVMSLELRNATGHVIPVKNLTEPISLFAATGQTPSVPSLVSLAYRGTVYHTLNVEKNDTSLHFEITTLDPNTELIVYLKRGSRPKPDDYDFKQAIPDEPKVNATFPKDRHLFFVSNADTNHTTAGTWYLGVYYNGTLKPEYQFDKKNVPKLFIPKKVNYTLRMYSSGCLFWDEGLDKWSGDGCVVGPQSKMDMVQCLCTHLTSFAGDFFVMPNAIDWSKISLDNLFSNPTVFAVVMAIFGLYIIGMIWARRKDKEDLLTIGTTPLEDNDPRDTYLYEIVFYTGHSAGAGTTANVCMILEGSIDETSPKIMKDPVRKKFDKSGVDTFLLAVPSSLGRLKNLRVWHDNAGESPGWFLQRILVQDMQTDKKTWFLCDKWLAVEEEDGSIERNLPPASRDDLTSFHLLFSTEARKSLTDNHLWFSVVKRPPRSTFTRCQRLSCCLTIILTTMLANAMFFQTDSTSSTGTELRAGPISFSVKQLSIAITSSMVVLPANILIVTLFRKAGPKQAKKKAESYTPEEDEESPKTAERKNEEVIEVEESPEKDKKDKKKKKKKKKKGKYPHWVIYVAYVVVAIASLVSATFTVFYGLTFGEEKSQKWIMTMMISFWQDVLISQPLKVFAAATFFAVVIKNPDKAVEEEDEDKKENSPVKADEELVHNKEKTEEDEMEDIKRQALMPKPPDQVKLEEMRRFKLKQKLMYKILREIMSYVIFVLILLTVAYGNRDYKSHHVNNALTSYFMGGSYAGKMAIGDISDINGFYKYLRGSLLPTLKPEFWYGPYDQAVSKVKPPGEKEMFAYSTPGFNGSKVYHKVHQYPSGYTADRANAWLVGIARIRQLRVIDKGCVFPKGVGHLVGRCSLPYSFDNEDVGHYEAGWVPMNKSKIELIKNDKWFKSPWSYKTAWQLSGTPYWGYFKTYWAGGYVSELSASYEEAVNKSKELEELEWLDGKTRAVFFEFTVYNPFTNFFAIINILTEILPTGGYYPYPYISTTRLYRYIGAEAKVIMVLEFVFFIYLLYYMFREWKELRTVGKRRYFRDPWNYFDLFVIVSSIVTIVFYFMRLVATKVVISRANEDPYSFTNFNYVVVLDGFVTAFMGLAVFVSFLKFLRLLRFNRTIGKLASTLRACVPPLASFFLLFIIVFLAYAQFAFMIFGPEMSDYSSFERCLSNMLGMTLGSFDFAALSATNRIIGPIFFFTYILVMVMILMNVFLSIINDTFNEVNSDATKQSSESEIADFMMDRFMATVKRTGRTVQPIYKEPKDKLDQNVDDIEEISDNVQQVLRSLCLESIRHTSWFKAENAEEGDKKRQILMLLMISGENFTESEVCDAIPVLDTVLAKYSSAQLKTITKNFQEKLAREEKEDAEKPEGREDDDDDNDDDDDDGDSSDGDSNSDRDENVFDAKHVRFDF
ncbi:polycystin-1-like isoform X2 [Dendronephthya gigantea]|uniref:polycystin-1-like isoform X2 n=1 Tax=Dendronephthya gigantea TaxID=151771 RepID=UPI00106AF440|nr:polycystin-1-like isoform X2 [Dendronephthya gigantea]